MATPLDPQSRPAASGGSSARGRDAQTRFWSGNLRLTLVLLVIWAAAGLGCGVLFADKLNAYKIGGYPLGFWFAQQGSIVVFVFLILAFCLIMNARDARHRRDLESDESTGGGGI